MGHKNGVEAVVVKDQGEDYNDAAITRNNNMRAIGTVGIYDKGGGEDHDGGT